MFQPDNPQNKKFVISLLVFAMLVSMLWKTVLAYINGGNDAPTLLILIIAILVLGGGAIFAGVMAYGAWRDMSTPEIPGEKVQLDMYEQSQND